MNGGPGCVEIPLPCIWSSQIVAEVWNMEIIKVEEKKAETKKKGNSGYGVLFCFLGWVGFGQDLLNNHILLLLLYDNEQTVRFDFNLKLWSGVVGRGGGRRKKREMRQWE